MFFYFFESKTKINNQFILDIKINVKKNSYR